MLGSMLVGAWLLIHHQCCVLADEDVRLKPLLVDTLTRRSSIEKNFMRFGRSLGVEHRVQPGPFDLAEADEPLAEKRARSPFSAKSNFIRLGRGKENFMRLGRGRGSENFIRFGRGGKKLLHDNDNFVRYGRGRDNLMRLGRAERARDFQDSFIRFGRSLPSPLHPGFIFGPELTFLPSLALNQRNANRAENMIRLG